MFFFILSGFWVTRSFFTSDSIISFYKKRIKKIFPPYITIVLGSALLLSFLSQLSLLEYFSNNGFWKYLVANLSTLNFLHPDLPGVFNGEPVNGSLWTIKIELGFYVVLPFIIYLCIWKNENSFRNRCLLILIILYTLSALYTIIIAHVIEYYNVSSSFANQLPAYMSYFSTGIFFFFFYNKISSMLRKVIIPSAIIVLFCIIFHNNILIALFEPITLGIVVMYFALYAKPLFIFSKIYDCSYWLYLIH